VSCAPEQVTGYVDDVLDPAARAEMEAHLATCAACREQEASERELKAGLKALPAPELRPGFEVRLQRSLAAERRRRFAWVLPFAAVLALLAVWARGAAPFVAWELSRDHAHCFGQSRLPAKVWSNDPVEIAAWFEGQGTHIPLVPAGVGELGLVGARYCPLVDRIVAHLYYAGEERRLSVFVLSGPVRFSDDWSARSRGRHVRFLRSAGMTVALVSDKPEDLEAFRSAFRTTVARLGY
jgi:anti-sigma factor RsiW